MLEYILDGGICMWPLMACSLIAMAALIDRTRVFRAAAFDNYSLRQKVLEALGDGRLNEAVELCMNSKGPIAAVLLVGLDKYRRLLKSGRSLTEIEGNVSKSMEDYASHALEPLERRLNLLTMMATIAPLLGMTGTVTGMINAFCSMASTGVDAEGVASGIAEALITTAVGLFIAMPAAAGYNIFMKQIDRYILEIELTVREVMDQISLGSRRA
ncbi:MAG: MotA/TolQ/ExbB proton channel family protein [Planctomycetota bacterium]|nr:MotA/TolQ/ExbB proton channel family protein [Planctomycetota bacterium]